MVNITPEEVMAMKRRPDPNGLSEMDKDIIGETCRIEIPFRDVHKMRLAAELLRGYADSLDFTSRRTDWSVRMILLSLREEARAINKRLREAKGPGRPRGES